MKKLQDPYLNRIIQELSTMREINRSDMSAMDNYQHCMKKINRNRFDMNKMMDYSSGYHNRVFRKEHIKTIKPFKVHHELVMATHSKNHKHKHQGPSYNFIK